MDRSLFEFVGGAAVLTWATGPRLAAIILVVFEAATALGASALEAAGTGKPILAAAAAIGATTMFLRMMLAPSAVGILLGWGVRRLAPPRRGRPRVTGQP